MFTSIKDFETDFRDEREGTIKILAALNDKSLAQSVAQDHRTIGRMAWHIVTSYPEMMSHAGIKIDSVQFEAPIPATATEILEGYKAVSDQMLQAILAGWNDETLHEEKNFYGMNWKLGFSLEVLIRHEVHHRAQITVLMRQAGLKVPGVYGPAREDWTGMGMNPPKV
jgi:uncharacterized damage-inducible protein DinB